MRERLRPLAAVLLAGLALRTAAVLRSWDAAPVLDETEYTAIASNLARDGAFALSDGTPTVRRPPLYPAFLAVFAAASDRPWPLARLGQAVLDTATAGLLFLFAGAACADPGAGLVAAALYALNPVFAAYSATLLSEPLFFFVWTAALLLLLRAAEAGEGAALRCAAAGLGLTLAIECRPTVILFPFFAAGALLLRSPGDRGLRRRMAAVVLAAYAGLAPWAARNRAVAGRLVPVATGGGASFWLGSQPWHGGDMPDWRSLWDRLAVDHDEAAMDAEFFRLARESWRERWPSIAANIPRRLRHFWVTSHSSLFGADRPLSEYRARGDWGPVLLRLALTGWQAGLLLLGAWGLWVSRGRWTAGTALVCAAMAYFSLHVLVDYFPNRYHLPALLLWLAPGGAGAVDAVGRMRRRAGPAKVLES